MPVVKNMVTIIRPGRSDWKVSQGTLDRIVDAIKSGTRLTVFEVAKRADRSPAIVKDTLRYYPPAIALIDDHMGVTTSHNKPIWGTPNTPIEDAPRHWRSQDFVSHKYADKRIAESVSKRREDVFKLVSGSKRKPTKQAKLISDYVDRTHFAALGEERGAIAVKLMDKFEARFGALEAFIKQATQAQPRLEGPSVEESQVQQ